MRPAFAIFALFIVTAPARAQLRDNRDTQLSCTQRGVSDRARACDMREVTMAPFGRLDVQPGRNGGAQSRVGLRAAFSSGRGWKPGRTMTRTPALSSRRSGWTRLPGRFERSAPIRFNLKIGMTGKGGPSAWKFLHRGIRI